MLVTMVSNFWIQLNIFPHKGRIDNPIYTWTQLNLFQERDNKVSEFEVWQGLANLYASLSYCRDAEICLQKAKALKTYSATTLHAEGEETLVTDS